VGVHVNTAYAGRWGVFPNWYLLGCELLSTCYPTYVHVHVMDKVWTTGVNQCARVCACLNSTAGGMCMCQSHSQVSELVLLTAKPDIVEKLAIINQIK